MNRLLFVSLIALLSPALHAHPGGHGDPIPGMKEMPPQQVESAYGRPGDSARIARTIPLVMSEGGGCSPGSVSVKQGEVIKFAARNEGKQLQEVAVGTPADLKSHADTVNKFPTMQVSRVNRASARNGQTVDLVWQFTRPGEFVLACGPAGLLSEKGLAKVTVTP